MIIDIFICTYNSEDTIYTTLNSILKQNYKNYRIIIIDNLSTDKTLDVVKSFKFPSLTIISEKDQGTYDAINKSFNLVTGDIAYFLHSDDQIYDNYTFNNVVSLFESNEIDILYGDIIYISKKNKILRKWVSGNFEKTNLYRGWMPPHTSLYIKKGYFQKLDLYNLKYKISSDYDFMLKFLKDPSLKIYYLNKYIVKMKIGGKSNKSIRNILTKSFEDYDIIRNHNLGGLLTLLYKNISKLKQFF